MMQYLFVISSQFATSREYTCIRICNGYEILTFFRLCWHDEYKEWQVVGDKEESRLQVFEEIY